MNALNSWQKHYQKRHYTSGTVCTHTDYRECPGAMYYLTDEGRAYYDAIDNCADCAWMRENDPEQGGCPRCYERLGKTLVHCEAHLDHD